MENRLLPGLGIQVHGFVIESERGGYLSQAEPSLGLLMWGRKTDIHRIGFLETMIRRMIVNRFFIANYGPWIRLTMCVYRRFVMEVDATTGAHVVAVFKQVG